MQGYNSNQHSMTRRSALWTSLKGAAALAAAPSAVLAAGGPTTAPTPRATEGPFWVDEKLCRSDIRSDPKTGSLQAGLPLNLSVKVLKLANGGSSPLVNACVDLWHCNAEGSYSDEPRGMGNADTRGQQWLRGYQMTEAEGVVRFTTIYPGGYQGRSPHIHARIRQTDGTRTTLNLTTQFFFDDGFSRHVYSTCEPYKSRRVSAMSNAVDNVYNHASRGTTTDGPDGKRMMLQLAEKGAAVDASFDVYVA